MAKYKISKEFFPFSNFTPPISEKFLATAVPHMKTPKFIFKDKSLDVSRHEIKSYDGEKIECFLMSPKSITKNAPCLIYIHGGGFVLAAAGYHYKNAMRYAKEVGCKVVFVNYRLAPQNPHPVFLKTVMRQCVGLVIMLKNLALIFLALESAVTAQAQLLQ